MQSSSRRQANSAEPAVSAEAVATTERRATVDRECARLEAEGAPAGTRWASPHPLNLMLHPACCIFCRPVHLLCFTFCHLDVSSTRSR